MTTWIFKIMYVAHIFISSGPHWSRTGIQTSLRTGTIQEKKMSREGLMGFVVNEGALAPLKGQLLFSFNGLLSYRERGIVARISGFFNTSQIPGFSCEISRFLNFWQIIWKKFLNYSPNKIYLWAEFSYQFELLAQRAQVWFLLSSPSARHMLSGT